MTAFSILAAAQLFAHDSAAAAFCHRGSSCWPTTDELQALYDALDPDMDRSLHWAGGESPRISAVPVGSPDDQPLFGMNQNLEPLYIAESNASTCGAGSADSDFCKQSARNLPKLGTQPAFIAWPLTAEHVQSLVSFGKEHNLCISVASTGHDFVERHSCDESLMIRTSLLKGVAWDLDGDDRSVRLGAGVVFSEVMESGARQTPSSYIASGWAQTVGVVGWGLGGGHGPHGRALGFGADNLLEVELVLANGSRVVASSSEHADLFWALRGGGGSTWGIITAVRYRAYETPQTGFTVMILGWNQSMCGAGEEHLHGLLEEYPRWAKKRSARWSGLALFQPAAALSDDCDASWNAIVKYVFHGDKADGEFLDALAEFQAADSVSIETYANFWQVVHAAPISEDYILAMPFPIEASTVGVPSVEVAEKDVDSSFSDILKARMEACKQGDAFLGGVAGYCVSLYHDIPGEECPQPVAEGATAIHPAFRSAMLHVMTSMSEASSLDDWLSLSEASYFSESTYNLPDWQQRYWGKHYAQLLDVKQAYDPEGRFWCHHCVGSESGPEPAPTPTPPAPTPGCPGGTLLRCIEICPTSPDDVYVACVGNCGRLCAGPSPAPAPSPPSPVPPAPAPAPTPAGGCNDPTDACSGVCAPCKGTCESLRASVCAQCWAVDPTLGTACLNDSGSDCRQCWYPSKQEPLV